MISAIWGSPQCGKTTLAVELATAIAHSGKSVCLISAEDFGDIATRFGKVIPAENSIVYACKNPQGMRAIAFPVTENLFVLGAALTDAFLNLTFSHTQAESLLRTAAAIYDEVIVDCTSWKANVITGTSISLAKIIFVPLPGRVSAAAWCNANMSILEKKADTMVYLKNETLREFDYEALFHMTKKTPEITLPYYPKLDMLQNDGKTIFDEGVTKYSQPYKKAISNIIGDFYS